MFNIDSNSRESETQGTWTEFDGGKFLVTYAGSIKFQRIFNRLQIPHRRKIAKGSLDPKVQRDILCKAMARGLLLDWDDITDKDGKEVQFSTKIAEIVLLNNTELREYIHDFATDLDNYREDEIESMGKSLKDMSNGGENGETG